jgi:hypothetical protein
MPPKPIPVFRISLTNATFLSGLYLLMAIGVEFVRRVWNPRWIDRLSLSLEAFPARTLELLGLFEPLRRAWVEERINPLQVRLIYALTTVSVIFALGSVVGAAMWLMSRLSARPSSPSKPP